MLLETTTQSQREPDQRCSHFFLALIQMDAMTFTDIQVFLPYNICETIVTMKYKDERKKEVFDHLQSRRTYLRGLFSKWVTINELAHPIISESKADIDKYLDYQCPILGILKIDLEYYLRYAMIRTHGDRVYGYVKKPNFYEIYPKVKTPEWSFNLASLWGLTTFMKTLNFPGDPHRCTFEVL